MAWSSADIPDQRGRRVIVTGANSGLGLATAAALGAAGAHVICACRDTAKGAEALADRPGAFEVRAIDLADLTSVAAFADGIDAPVDVLVNNAGVMAVPRRRTADDFEMQFGTNHLGHFALTGRLLDRITARVVTVSSFAHRVGRIRLDDLNAERGYQRWLAYSQSKLANLMFAYELEHRLVAAGSTVHSMAAHPGLAATNLGSGVQLVGQPAAMGALPTLYAATEPELPGGSFVGPDGLLEMRGHPRPVRSSGASRDRETQRRLWAESERLTGVRFSFAHS